MKKLVLVAVAGLAFASAAAYAQTQYPRAGEESSTDRNGSGQLAQMHGGMMHGGMMQRGQGGMGPGRMDHGDMMRGMRGGMDHDGMRQGDMMHGGHGRSTDGAATHGSSAGHAAQPKGDRGPSSLAFQAINAKMHQAMDITFTGNADADFVRGMIPHHEGAVDMAKTVLAFGKDPEVRKLAEAIVKAQESEIALMRDWLKKTDR